MKKIAGAERRKTQRLNIPLHVKYSLSVKKKALIERVFAKNISGGGLGLKLNQPLRVGTRLKTLLYFPQDQRPVTSVSQVVWCGKARERGIAYFDVGIKHLRIMPKDRERFVFLFCETMINYFLVPEALSLDGKNSKKNSHR